MTKPLKGVGFHFIIVLFWGSLKSESETKTTLGLKVKGCCWPLPFPESPSFPHWYQEVQFIGNISFANHGLQRIPVSLSQMSLLNVKTFPMTVVKELYSSGEHGQVCSLVSQNKSILACHLPKSSVPCLTIMPRYFCITTSFTAGHYRSKLQNQSILANYKVSLLLFLNPKSSVSACMSMNPWLNILIIHAHISSPGRCQY